MFITDTSQMTQPPIGTQSTKKTYAHALRQDSNSKVVYLPYTLFPTTKKKREAIKTCTSTH